MREIKFRAWDIEGKYIISSTQSMATIISKELSDIPHHYKIMQYTGLKDKNGKEIYEGDIVKKENNKLYQIKYKEFGFQAIDNLGQNWYLTDWYKCEIIGNIYENPELLEKQ